MSGIGNKTRALGARAHDRRSALIRWAFYDRRNLRIAMAAVVGLLIVVSVLSSIAGAHMGSGDSARATSAQSTGESSSELVPDTARALAPTGTDDHPDGAARTRAQSEEGARTRAQEFLTQWLTTTPASSWYERVSPLAAPGLTSSLESTNLKALPKATVKSLTTTSSDPFAMTVRALLTDKTSLDVDLGWNGAEWLVTSYKPTGSGGK